MSFAAEAFIEDQKNKLLQALYDTDYKTCKTLFYQTYHHALDQPYLTENYEKRLRQILIVFKRYKSVLDMHGSLDINFTIRNLKQLLSESTRKAYQNRHSISFTPWKQNLNLDQNQIDLLFKTVMTFQLTIGCSHYCRRCNEWALPGVRSHFNFNAITQILKHISDQKNTDISLYGASDPLDWIGKQKDISDIIAVAVTQGIEYSVLTKLPKGKNELLKKLVRRNSNLSVSITNKNRNKISRLEQNIKQSISKQHDTDELLIPAGLDEDFVSVKPSITDGYGCEITPDGAYIIIPTFTSALYPFGHAKIPVTKDTLFFPEKKTGRQALLVDYFKPLKGYNRAKQNIHLPTLMPVQVESILLDNGSDALTPPGMRSVKEYFSIFDKKARLQRKKMTPVVMKKLKKQYLATLSFKDLSPKIKAIYRKKIQAHIDMNCESSCLSFRLLTISFFLTAVDQYQNNNLIKIKIILYLLKEERTKSLAENFLSIAEDSIENLLLSQRYDPFDVFRHLIFHLISPSQKTDQILSFIKKYPAAYDPTQDLFIPKKPF